MTEQENAGVAETPAPPTIEELQLKLQAQERTIAELDQKLHYSQGQREAQSLRIAGFTDFFEVLAKHIFRTTTFEEQLADVVRDELRSAMDDHDFENRIEDIVRSMRFRIEVD